VNNNAAASGGNTSAPAPNNINNSNISINNLASLPTFSKGNSQSNLLLDLFKCSLLLCSLLALIIMLLLS